MSSVEKSQLTIRQDGAAMTLSETVPHVFTAPTTLDISFALDTPDPDRRPVHSVVAVTIDQIAFEFAPYPPIEAFSIDEFPRVRAAVVEECERRLVRTITALQAELSRVSAPHEGNGSGSSPANARDRALRHAGWIAPVEQPPPAHERPAPRLTRVPSSSYLPGRAGDMFASGYLPPERHDRSSSARLDAAAPFGGADRVLAGADIGESGADPAGVTSAFPAPPRPASPEHQAASRLLHCQDLLRGLRARWPP